MSVRRRRFLRSLGVAFATPIVVAQEFSIPVDDLMDEAEQWVKDNADEDLLKALEQVDREQVEEFFKSLDERLKGEYVFDLVKLKKAARTFLPMLESHEETAPYAAWLKTRLDYFDVAETLEQAAPPVQTKPEEPPKPRPNPTPAQERKVWQQVVEQRPVPPEAKEYVPRLKSAFRERNVPEALIWVAEVESSFNPKAKSPVGAAGLYQLMPATAKSLGLSLFPRDERLNPDKAGAAAAKYLALLYPKFKDWPLVMAAYNAGEGNVRRLMEKMRAKTFDGISPKLPAETQMYVPKIEAVLLKREGVRLSQLPPVG